VGGLVPPLAVCFSALYYGEMFNAGVAFVQLGTEPARAEKGFRRWAEAQRAQPRMARHLTA